MFEKNDKYFVGKNTCGAKLFVDINDIRNAQVNGVDSSSAIVIQPGINNSLLIPIKFQ